jgi:phosphopantetheine adenylyltransferase
MDLANRRKNVEDYLQETRATEVDLVKELEEKYGKGTVNLGTEEFVPDQE